MESEDKLNEIDIKNRTCYYFEAVIRFWDRDINFSDILLDKNWYKERNENILVYDISYKTSTGARLLHIRLDKIDGFIKIHDKIRYLVLFDYSYCDKVCDKIKYLISEKSSTTNNINHNFARIRIDSYDSLPIEKILTFQNVVILIKSVVNKYKNEYYFNIYLHIKFV